MSEQVVVQKPKLVIAEPLKQFFLSLDLEYQKEDDLKDQLSKIRKAETQALTKDERKELRKLRKEKRKMLAGEIEFNIETIKRLNELRQKMREASKDLREEAKEIRAELKRLHEQNRITFYKEIKPYL